MRYRLMATYRGAPYEAGIGPEDDAVVLFAACPPPEDLGFEPATGHWRKELRIQDVQAVWESRPVGMFRGERCIVLDDLGDRLHIGFPGHDGYRAEQLGYWQVDRGVFELVANRDEVSDIVEERTDYPYQPDSIPPGSRPDSPPRPADAGSPPPAGQTTAEFPTLIGLSEQGRTMPKDGGAGLLGDAGAALLGDSPPPSAPAAGPLPLEAQALRASAAARRDQPDHGPERGHPGDQADFGQWNGLGRSDDLGRSDGLDRADELAPSNGLGRADLAPSNGRGRADELGRSNGRPASSTPTQNGAGTLPSAGGAELGDVLSSEADRDFAPIRDLAPGWPATPDTSIPPGGFIRPEAPVSPGTSGTTTSSPASHSASTPSRAGTARGITPEPPAATAGSAGSSRRQRSARRRLATERVFSELASLAAIPASAYSVGEEVDGAMCLLETADGFEVFTAAGGARHEVRVFSDEESACFYLFGVLAADAVRTGVLVPGHAAIPAAPAPESLLHT